MAEDKKAAAQSVDNQLKEAVRIGTFNVLAVGKLLHEVREQELWAELGAKTFDEYTSLVAGLGAKRANARIRLWEVYGKYDLTEKDLQPVTKMRLLIPIVNKGNVRAWLKRAAEMSCAELTVSVLEEKKRLRKAGKLARLRKDEVRAHIMGLAMSPEEEGQTRRGIDYAKEKYEDVKTNGQAVALMVRIAHEYLTGKRKAKAKSAA